MRRLQVSCGVEVIYGRAEPCYGNGCRFVEGPPGSAFLERCAMRDMLGGFPISISISPSEGNHSKNGEGD